MDDTNLRKIIINDIDKNIFVDASAGAGKTASLVRRMVRMVECGINVDKICTITFTKNAANEFYERFQDLLSKRSDPNYFDERDLMPRSTPESRKKCTDALKNIDLCFLGTIDAFTNMVVSSYPQMADMSESVKLATKADMEKVLKEIYFGISAGAYDEAFPTFKEKQKLYEMCVDDGLEAFLSEEPTLLEKRYAEFNIGQALTFDKSDLRHELLSFRTALKSVMRNLELSKTSSDALKRFVYSYKTINRFDNFSKVANITKDFDKVKFNAKDFDQKISSDAPIRDFLNLEKRSYVINSHLIEEIRVLDKYRFNCILDFLLKSLELTTCVLKEKNILTFSEYLITVRDMLKRDIENGGKLINHIKQSHEYFLLDESQDTNPIQTEIFFYLTSTNLETDWTKCNPKEGRLFIVGDPKQSIYRFRGADVSTYLKTKEIFREKYEVIELTKNFRSNKSMKEWFNMSMSDYITTDDGNPKFTDIFIPSDEKDDKGGVCGVYKYSVVGDVAKTIEEEDSKYVVSLIKMLVDNDKYKIKTKKDKEARTIKYSDFMVVTRKKKFNVLLEMLDKESIPYYSEGVALFDSSPLFLLIKTILYHLLDKDNEIYRYNFLTSGYIGMSKEEYANLSAQDVPNKKLQKAEKLYNETANLSLSSTYAYLLETLPQDGVVSLANIDVAYYGCELLRQAEASGMLYNNSKIVSFLDSLSSANKDYERSLMLQRSANSIQISNVHKVKGLQAPIVVLCARNETNRINDEILITNDGQIKANVIRLCGIKDSDKFDDLLASEVNAEAKRIDYVAVTRAEVALFIGEVKSTKGEEKKSSWSGIAKYADRYFNIDERITKKDVIEKDIKELLTDKKTLDRGLFASSLSYVSPSRLEVEYSKENSENIKDADTLGTVIHKLMEMIVKSNFTLSESDVILYIEKEFGKDYVTKAKKVYKRIFSGGYNQSNKLDSDIIKTLKNAKEVYTEVPFSYMDGSNLISGVIDLIYEDIEGFHIIDYKTTREGDSIVLEEKYHNQLEEYKSALKKICNIDASANIYHIDV